jgi:hypothetical protein
MSEQNKYLYGIIEEPHPRRFGFSGVEDAEVYTINYQKMAAIVSDTLLQEVDPTRKNVRAHTVVQDEILKVYDLLPMGFGVIAHSDDEVQKLLERNYQLFVKELERLASKIEVGLKVFWDQEAMIKELQGERQDLTKIKAKINAAASPVEAQHLMVEAGKLIERIAMEWKNKYAEQVYAALKGMAVDARLNAPLGVKNILNAAFLVDRAKESGFQKEVYKLDSKYQGKVDFKYVGPLPPYSFVNLKLEPVK